ncbi:MAG: hypothetical protein AB8G14_10210 [Ilumatobacter sp.]
MNGLDTIAHSTPQPNHRTVEAANARSRQSSSDSAASSGSSFDDVFAQTASERSVRGRESNNAPAESPESEESTGSADESPLANSFRRLTTRNGTNQVSADNATTDNAGDDSAGNDVATLDGDVAAADAGALIKGAIDLTLEAPVAIQHVEADATDTADGAAATEGAVDAAEAAAPTEAATATAATAATTTAATTTAATTTTADATDATVLDETADAVPPADASMDDAQAQAGDSTTDSGNDTPAGQQRASGTATPAGAQNATTTDADAGVDADALQAVLADATDKVGVDPKVQAGARRVVEPAGSVSPSGDLTGVDAASNEQPAPDLAPLSAPRVAQATARLSDHVAMREMFDRIERHRNSLDGSIEMEILTERFGSIRIEAAEGRDGVHLSLRGSGDDRALADLADELRQEFERNGVDLAGLDVGERNGAQGDADSADDTAARREFDGNDDDGNTTDRVARSSGAGRLDLKL